MPKWIHDRAKHLRAKNPDMSESASWAIATQQAHALGKSPKSYGTVEGRTVAKKKYDTPGDDAKTAGTKQAMNLLSEIPGTQGVHLPGFSKIVDGLESLKANLGHSAPVKRLTREEVMASRRASLMRKMHQQKAKVAEAEPEKEFKLQGHLEHQGIAIAVENRKGSVRKGVDNDGKPWRTVMKHPYGYIKGTKGKDGEEIDAYVGPAKDAPTAFVVHQRHVTGKGHDEDKVMLGFVSKKDAIKGFLEHYDDKKFLGPVSEVPVEKIKEIVEAGKPVEKISAVLPDGSGSFTGTVGKKKIKKSEIEKVALVERLARLAATDIPNTPRLLMRHRSPEELAGIQHSVDKAFERVQGPMRQRFEGAISRMPDKIRPTVSRAGNLLIDHPELVPMQAVPLPGLTPAYLGIKKGLEKVIDKTMPLKTVQASALFQELAKLGTVSDEQAARSLDRYESLEKNKPTLGQVGRYAALGAAAGPVIGAVGNVIKGRAPGTSTLSHLSGAKLPGLGGAVRGVASSAATGAIGSGAIPLVRAQLDRKAEMGTLKKYLGERHPDPEAQQAGRLGDPFTPVEKGAAKKEKDSAALENTPAKHWNGQGIYLNAAFDGEKSAFATSQYDSGMGPPSSPQVSHLPAFRAPSLLSPVTKKTAASSPTRGGFLLASDLPPFTAPSLRSPLEERRKVAGVPVTPEGKLHASMRVGAPKATAPSGPSISQVAKPVGFGKPMSGAKKTGI